MNSIIIPVVVAAVSLNLSIIVIAINIINRIISNHKLSWAHAVSCEQDMDVRHMRAEDSYWMNHDYESMAIILWANGYNINEIPSVNVPVVASLLMGAAINGMDNGLDADAEA